MAKQGTELLLERIDERLAALGKTRYWLSLQITEGRNHGTIRDIARRGSMPAADRLAAIARHLETTTDYLVGTASTPDQVLSEVTFSDKRIEWNGRRNDGMGLPLVGTGDCADLEVCTDTGELVSIDRASFDPEYHVTYITRPTVLRGDRDAYAIYFHGDSMSPRFESGEVGIAQPSRPAAPGDYVIVQLRAGESDDVGSVIVKKLVKMTANELLLEQFNPPLRFTLARSKVVRVHRLMPPDATFFV